MQFTDYEIHPIKRSPTGTFVAAGEEHADFFTLYGRTADDELFAVGDFNSREEAEACKRKIRTE